MSIFPTTILLATDGSGDAELALSTAVDLANNNDSELHIVTVERGLPTEGSHEDEAAAQDAGQLLEEQAEKAGGTVAQTHLKRGERPDRGILRLAEEIDAGLIVMGSKGLGEIEEALLGTVADSVVRHAHCLVLVVRSDRQAASNCWAALGDRARPYLRELVELSGESANLAVMDGAEAVYVEQVPAPHTVRMCTESGRRVPLHCTGVGKTLLAYQPERVVDAVLWQKSLRRFTPHTITDVRRFKNALDRIRRHGYATDFGDMEEGIRCLAAPVFGSDGEVIAAMSVSGPVGRLTRVCLEKLVFSIKRITAELSESLRASA